MSGIGLRRWAARLAVALLGTIALLLMAPQFAFYVPIVLAVYVLARFGIVPRPLRVRHESARFVGLEAGPGWAFAEVVVEGEPEHADRAGSVMREVLDLAIARLGRPAASSAGAEVPAPALLMEGLTRRHQSFWIEWPGDVAGASAVVADGGPAACGWPAIAEHVSEGRARLVIDAGIEASRSLRLHARLAGGQELIAELLASAALSLRSRGGEAITTGWVREAEREALARHRRAARSA
jgi:hypothetical protein